MKEKIMNKTMFFLGGIITFIGLLFIIGCIYSLIINEINIAIPFGIIGIIFFIIGILIIICKLIMIFAKEIFSSILNSKTNKNN